MRLVEPPFSLVSPCLRQSYNAPTKQLTLRVSLVSLCLSQSYNTPTKQLTLRVWLASSAVFIPLSAWRPSKKKILQVWGEHGNYSTSSYKNGSMVHIRITATLSKFDDTSDPNQGCMSRLVQNY